MARAYLPHNLDSPEPPGVILTVARLVPAAHRALPADEFESRIEDYRQRIEAGLPTPLFGREQPAERAVKPPRHVAQCWACGRTEKAKGEPPAGWHTREVRLGSALAAELYCPKCFAIWGWPDEFDTIICAVEGVAAILAGEGVRVDSSRCVSGREPAHARSRRGAAGRRKAVSV